MIPILDNERHHLIIIPRLSYEALCAWAAKSQVVKLMIAEIVSEFVQVNLRIWWAKEMSHRSNCFLL